MSSSRVFQALALALALLALVGCGNSDEGQAVPQTVATPTAPPPTTAPTPTVTTENPSAVKPKPRPTTIRIKVVEGRPQGGIARPSVKKNSRVVLIVRSDIADEVHLHGYDISRPVAAGGTARLAFVAKVPGRFEVELEDIGAQIAELTVR